METGTAKFLTRKDAHDWVRVNSWKSSRKILKATQPFDLDAVFIQVKS